VKIKKSQFVWDICRIQPKNYHLNIQQKTKHLLLLQCKICLTVTKTHINNSSQMEDNNSILTQSNDENNSRKYRSNYYILHLSQLEAKTKSSSKLH
jgi:hypothetical protein